MEKLSTLLFLIIGILGKKYGLSEVKGASIYIHVSSYLLVLGS